MEFTSEHDPTAELAECSRRGSCSPKGVLTSFTICDAYM